MMSNVKRTALFSRYSSKNIVFGTIALVIFGSLMIASAAMGGAAGDTTVFNGVIIRQLVFTALGFIGMVFFSRNRAVRFHRVVLDFFYYVILVSLLVTRAFGSAGGAYAWIRIPGGFTIQPSEFAKVFIIVYLAKVLGSDEGKNNIENFKTMAIRVVIYAAVILFWQKDLGSAVVFFVIAYCVAMIPPFKQIRHLQNIMVLFICFAVVMVLFILSPIGTALLSKMGSYYMIGRFLSSANPFKYLYDDGYHLVMSLVTFASGNFFGLGYGNSIHKYMNFPNPTTDFILPVIVEELGAFGFIIVVILYGMLLYPLYKYSTKTNIVSSKMILLGVFLYIIVHFILNVGGVSGIIPLTGVPLLILSSGGSSTIATMCALGIAESEIIKYEEGVHNANNSR